MARCFFCIRIFGLKICRNKTKKQFSNSSFRSAEIKKQFSESLFYFSKTKIRFNKVPNQKVKTKK